jgi:hypothetical protein
MMCIIAVFTTTSSAVEPAEDVSQVPESRSASKVDQILSLKLEFEALALTREAALSEIQARYEIALPHEKTAIELEGAAINTDYDRAYLELLTEYHRLNGNEAELERAEAQLEIINAGIPLGTPLTLERNRAEAATEPANIQEVIIHE